MSKTRSQRAGNFFLFTLVLATCLAARGQTIIANYVGLSLNQIQILGTALTPPDTMGAVGTNQFVQFLNGAFAVYTKAYIRTTFISDSNFWARAGIDKTTLAVGLTDPRITYDVGSGRWFATELTVSSVTNLVLVGRSESSNPGGSWKATNFLASAAAFGDFDTLGVDSQGIYVSVNDFDASGTTFLGVSFFSIPKADLLASSPSLANMTRFDDLDANTYGFALQGVNNPDPGPGHGVIIAIDTQNLNYLDRTTVNNPGGAGATLSTTTYIFSAYDGSPNPPAQPNGSTVDGGDDRFSAAVRQIGGYIFMANCILNTNNNRDAVHWLVLNETNNTVTSEGMITDPNFDFTYPSIAASHSGKVLLGFNRIGTSAPSGDISIYAAVGTVANGVATMGAPFLLKPGSISNYHFGPQPYRWGDYSATMFDPTDDDLVWTFQEIPAGPTLWGTQITLISFATNSPSLSVSLSGKFATLSWPLSTDPAYMLQSNTNALDAGSWTPLVYTKSININQNSATFFVNDTPTFFRLSK